MVPLKGRKEEKMVGLNLWPPLLQALATWECGRCLRTRSLPNVTFLFIDFFSVCLKRVSFEHSTPSLTAVQSVFYTISIALVSLPIGQTVVGKAKPGFLGSFPSSPSYFHVLLIPQELAEETMISLLGIRWVLSNGSKVGRSESLPPNPAITDMRQKERTKKFPETVTHKGRKGRQIQISPIYSEGTSKGLWRPSYFFLIHRSYFQNHLRPFNGTESNRISPLHLVAFIDNCGRNFINK